LAARKQALKRLDSKILLKKNVSISAEKMQFAQCLASRCRQFVLCSMLSLPICRGFHALKLIHGIVFALQQKIRVSRVRNPKGRVV